MSDIPISDAMLCWSSARDGAPPAFRVVRHPDRSGASDGYSMTVGACFTNWRAKSKKDQQHQLMIDAWHATAFYGVPAAMVHEGLLVVPEYRDMLADDCLPREFAHERD